MNLSYKEWIQRRTFPASVIDKYLNAAAPNSAQFDPVVGYIPKTSSSPDGIHGATTWYHYGAYGERRMLQWADRECRINSYGDSFTQGAQVSDGETWQEYLAAHLGEPIRNFGIGGQGAYHAYLRVLEKEQVVSAKYLTFYIWGDDHHRSIMPWRGFFCYEWLNRPEHRDVFHINPWRHLVIDPYTGNFTEAENFCPTPQSLYRLSDAEFVWENLRDNLVVQLAALAEGIPDVPTEKSEAMAATLELPFDAKKTGDATKVYDAIAHNSTLHVLKKLREFTSSTGRELLVLLGGPDGEVRKYLHTKQKHPDLERVIQYLQEEGMLYRDGLDLHAEDYANFNLSPEAYTDRFYNGHYRPAGNHFFAFGLREQVVNWMQPRPLAYRAHQKAHDYTSYLPEAAAT